MDFKVISQKEVLFICDGVEYERIETIFTSNGEEKTSIDWCLPYPVRESKQIKSYIEKEYQKYLRQKKLERLTNEENY